MYFFNSHQQLPTEAYCIHLMKNSLFFLYNYNYHKYAFILKVE